MDELLVYAIIPASAARIYKDWLSSDGHTNMTGGEAEISSDSTARFTAWDGYISGQNLQLEENKRIFQSWRTVEFPEDAEHSKLEVIFEEIDPNSTKVTITQSNIPEGDGKKYEDGWKAHYFEPMTEYYSQN
ncbi:SRPBCC domain-containing protein [Paracrocinitomix mangrovi]|uniref:SRPBCC domain-containing protein n=1 Tax=Paracrocinitomix mangrovi TaxID=2862509 RepID=UPI001C8D8025|nr:SRPBCC domain-containing protein [Paracrocinitomix mangrovi]UKN02359.1 SRPBCC domain-containing protein [Paracrocinitomix mangrovi]